MFAEHGLSRMPANARVIQIHMDEQFPARGADQERLPLHRQRKIGCLPVVPFQEQVLPRLEPEQRHRLEATVLQALEHDRIVRLDGAELGREDRRQHDRVAQRLAAADVDTQIAVIDVVEQGVSGHCGNRAVRASP